MAGHDVEPAEGSDGTDGRWRIAPRVAPDRAGQIRDDLAERGHIEQAGTATPGDICCASPKVTDDGLIEVDGDVSTVADGSPPGPSTTKSPAPWPLSQQ